MVQKYIVVYLKHRAQLAAVIAMIVAVPLLIVALLYDVVPYDLYLAFAPVILAACYFSGCCVRALLFRNMIRQQETQHNILFPEVEGECLQHLLYLSEDWLILAGRFALCRQNIADIRMKRKDPGTNVAVNQVAIATVWGKKLRFHNSNSSAITRIRHWLDQAYKA